MHFYLIAWSRIAKLARFIASRTRFRRVGLTVRRYASDLDPRVAARDHLEHFEERLPGGPKQQRLARQGDLLNMVGTRMSYGGSEVDVGPDSAKLLAAFVREIRQALLYDAVETLATLDLAALKRHIDRAATELRIARISRQVLRGWGEAQSVVQSTTAERSLGTDRAARRT